MDDEENQKEENEPIRFRFIHPGRRRTLTFGYGHSFWEEAVRLAQQQEPVSNIVQKAKALGYALTATEIRAGLYSAPANLNLPIPGVVALRRQYEKISNDFNAFEIMKDLTLEATRTYSEATEDLLTLDRDIPEGLDEKEINRRRRSISAEEEALEEQRRHWFREAFKAVQACADIEVRLRDPAANNNRAVPDEQPEEVGRWIQELREDFQKRLPTAPGVELVEEFGQNNVRLPVIEGEVITNGMDEES